MTFEAIIVQFMWPVVAAAIASYITVKLSLARFYREKLWERKLDAYSAIVDALHEMKAVAEDDLDAALNDSQLGHDVERERWDRRMKARAEIRRAADTVGLLVSRECAGRLQRMRMSIELGIDHPMSPHRAMPNENGVATGFDPHFEMRMDLSAVSSCLKEIKAIARDDLLGTVGLVGRFGNAFQTKQDPFADRPELARYAPLYET